MSYPEECVDQCGKKLTRVVQCRDVATGSKIPDQFCLAPKPPTQLQCPVCSIWDNHPITGICEQKDPANPKCGTDPANWGKMRQKWVCRAGPGQCQPEPAEPPPDAACEIKCAAWQKTYQGQCRNEDTSILCDMDAGGQDYTWSCPAGAPGLCAGPEPNPGWEQNGCKLDTKCNGNWEVGPWALP